MKLKFTLPLVCALAGAVLLTGCGKHAAPPDAPMVTVSRPAQEQVADSIDLTGTLSASKSVDLVARVSGYLKSVNFQDGAYVEEGQLLFVIEPEPYEQQVRLAQAALLQAQSEYDRQTALMKENATSAANVEKWLSQRDQASAQVELAKINLGYTRITAPFSGRMSANQFDPGNLVGPGGKTKLATITQLIPINVDFNLNERDALQIRTAMRQLGLEPKQGVGKAPVLVGLQNETGYPHQGTLDFVDSNVSTSSGTVQMRAVFKNEDKALWPGLFARVRIPLGDPKPMLLVPNRAIGNDQEGDYVLVADAGDIVARRAVVKGPLVENRCAIRSGLNSTNRVIINGLMRAKPGAKIMPVSETPARLRLADPFRTKPPMFAKLFIERPVLANVIAILIMLLGGVAVYTLPVEQYPPITPPTVQVTATYPGASAKTLVETVALPIEQQVNGVEKMLYMQSTCTSDGRYTLNVTFQVGTDLDFAQVLVQNRVAAAMAQLPASVQQQGVVTKKKSTAILQIITLTSTNPAHDALFLSNYATMHLRDKLARLPGVGDVTVIGVGEYSMRIWLDPELMRQRSLTPKDVIAAIQRQNAKVAAGQIGMPPTPPARISN